MRQTNIANQIPIGHDFLTHTTFISATDWIKQLLGDDFFLIIPTINVSIAVNSISVPILSSKMGPFE